MKKENWIHMPHAAHFIGAANCQFHMSTYVGGYIISSVGEYLPEYLRREGSSDWQEIGHDRLYETMVFKAKRANGERDCLACPYVVADFESVDFLGYKTAKDASKGHLKLCKIWSAKK